MAANGGNSNQALAFIAGAAIVAAAGVAVRAYTGNLSFGQEEQPPVAHQLPDIDAEN
jgi:hypothetical protein